MSIHLRVDDYPGTKPDEFTRHNFSSFWKFHDIVSEYFSVYVLGIIPYHLTKNDESALRSWSRTSMIPALHGARHLEDRGDEFGGLTIDQTISQLAAAKGVLEHFVEHQVVDYIPPHNMFAQNTIDALYYHKFKNIYGGPGSPDPGTVDLMGLEMRYSTWPWGYGRSDELLLRDDSVDQILAKQDEGVDVWLTLHWTWEQNIGLENLERYLDVLKRSHVL